MAEQSDWEKEIQEALQEADVILEKLRTKYEKKEKKPTLMIVEDDKNVALGLENMFEDDYKIRIFYDGTSALAAMQDLSPDTAILDMKLPDIHGFDLLREIKKIRPALPIIVYTGYPGEYPEKTIITLGTSWYIEKGNPDSYQKLKNFTSTAVQAYQDFKRGIIKSLLDDFQQQRFCKFSAIFQQYVGKFLTSEDLAQMNPKLIGVDPALKPLCNISDILSSIRSDEGHRICPYHDDIDPALGSQKFSIGNFSSHPCIYYRQARFGKPDKYILEVLKEKADNHGIA